MSRVRTLKYASTTTGSAYTQNSTGTTEVDLYQVMGTVTANVSHPATKTISWKMQGSLSGVAWTDLNAAATTSTGTAQVNSTVSGSYNKVRILVTGTNTTGDITTTWAVGGRP